MPLPLLLLEFLKCDDLVADFREARGLRRCLRVRDKFRCAAAAALRVAAPCACVAVALQPKLAQTGANETHKRMLTEQLFEKEQFTPERSSVRRTAPFTRTV